MKYTLGVDFGGSSAKATLLDEHGAIVAVSGAEYPMFYARTGWAEQRCEDWIVALGETVRSVLARGGVRPDDIEVICIDSATHSAVLTDARGTPLRHCIHWTDNRSKSQVEALNRQYKEMIFARTYHLPETMWTLPQLMWVRENEPEVWGKVRRIYFEKDWIRFRLTGEYWTDYIEAQGSMLYDFGERKWSGQLCEIIALDAGLLPPIIAPTDWAGKVTEQAAKETGLTAGTPVICGTTDTVLEIFAAGAVREGQKTVKLATAGRICVISPKACPSIHLVNYAHLKEGLWYPGTATRTCATSYRWYRDTFGENYKELDAAAATAPVGADGLIFHPYLNGELTPYADPYLKGSFTGVTANHTKAHFSRAVMEGVAFSLLDCQLTLDELELRQEKEAKVLGGGAKSALWRKIVTDMLGITLHVPENSDSSFGGAMLAGIAAGFYRDCDDAVNICCRVVGSTYPDVDNHEAYMRQFKIYKKVHDALAPIYSGKS